MKKILFLFLLFTCISYSQAPRIISGSTATTKFWGWRLTQTNISALQTQIDIVLNGTALSVTIDSTIYSTVWQLDTAKTNIYNLMGSRSSLYQPVGTYLIPTDSGYQRAYSNALYQTKGTYLIPSDTNGNYAKYHTPPFDSTSLSNRINAKRDSILNMKDIDTAGIAVGKVIMRGVGNWVMATVSGSGGTGNLDSLSTVLKAYADADTAKARTYTNTQLTYKVDKATYISDTTGNYAKYHSSAISWDSTYAPKKAYADAKYQAKGTYLTPSDTTSGRTFSDLKYQAKGALVPSDSTANRTFTNLQLSKKLNIVDTTGQRTFSDLKYQAKATYLIPSDSSAIRTYSDLRYAYKTIYGSATITNDTVITITHGYGSSPPSGSIMITPTSNTMGASYYVDAIGSTTFRIHCCIQGDYSFFWLIPRN